MPERTNFDLNVLPIFVKVAELKSFSAAARSLGRPKSTVSRSITQLEDDLGVRLVERTTRQVRLTDVGALFYRHCLRVLSDLDEAEDAVNQLRSKPRGRLNVSLPTTLVREFLGPHLAEFLHAYPEIDLFIQITNDTINIFDEDIDVVVRAGKLTDSMLITRRLGTTRLGLVASPVYLATHGMPRDLDALADHPVLGYRDPNGMHPGRLEGPDGSHDLQISRRVSANEPLTVRDLTLGGVGIGLLPLVICVDALDAGQLVRVLKDWASPPVELHALFSSHRSLSPKVRVFVDFLVDYCKKLGLS